jgi:hypothetical protein
MEFIEQLRSLGNSIMKEEENSSLNKSKVELLPTIDKRSQLKLKLDGIKKQKSKEINDDDENEYEYENEEFY